MRRVPARLRRWAAVRERPRADDRPAHVVFAADFEASAADLGQTAEAGLRRHEAEIFVGKMPSNRGSSLGRSTPAGSELTVANGCPVVSMSLGRPVEPGQGFLHAFETPAREAMRRNTLQTA